MNMDDDIFDFAALAAAELKTTPYPYLIVNDFIKKQNIPAINDDFPEITQGGSFPIDQLVCGQHFQRLVDAMHSEQLKAAIAAKFNIELDDYPTMLTARGYSRKKDGRIHTDSVSKKITALLYLNNNWLSKNGWLRILNGEHDLNDYVEEVSPEFGTLLIFQVTDNCWHGYVPYEGVRRSLQLNYVVNESALNKHVTLHRFTSTLKRWYKKLKSQT